MKAVLQYRASPAFRTRLLASAPDWLKIVIVDEADREAFRAEIKEADVLLHVLEPVTAAVMEAAPRLKLIQKIGVGVNTIDQDAARARGIAVANMPGTNSQAVAEHTLALMLTVLRRVAYLDRACRQNAGWTLPIDALDRSSEIHGRAIGFVGYGAVPQRLAPALHALGARVFYYSHAEVNDGIAVRLPSLEDLMRQVDIVSLHVPLTPTSRGLINEQTLSWVKPGAFLINTARGELVDEKTLYRALVEGRLAGAGVDVFAAEPVPADDPLLQLDTFVATPHIGWLTIETLERSIEVVMENCQRLRSAEPLLNQIH